MANIILMPILNRSHRILDFSSGKCAYANMLRNNGYKILMYEPFIRKEGKIVLILQKLLNALTILM